jgi:hypothetical protein
MSVQSLKILMQAGSVSLGELEHPNKMPFEGILTWFNAPSDKPVGGAGGKRVLIPSEYGTKGLASLRGMAVNFDSLWMDKHVSTNKIGIIEDAWVGEVNEEGAIPVNIRGFVYAHDFPEEAQQIKEEQASLGFSYETIDTAVVDGVFKGEQVLLACADLVFSGAAILLKDKAAYTNTSLAAQAEELNEEEAGLDIEKIIEAVVTAMESKFELKAKADTISEEVEETKEEPKAEDLEASAETNEGDIDVVTEAGEIEEDKVLDDTEKLDFKAMAEEYKTQFEAMKAEFEKVKADLKAEADAREMNEHKGFRYPVTLAAKYNLDASADTYESKIDAVDARTDLSASEKMALKWEIRDQYLKSQR